MKKGKLVSALMVATVALASFPVMQTHAALTSGSAALTGSASVTNSSSTTTPLGPLNSQVGVGWSASSSIVLNEVPNLDFGIHTLGDPGPYDMLHDVDNNIQLVKDKNGKITGTSGDQRMLVVTDQTGKQAGWHVTVAYQIGTDASDLSKLSGAKLTISGDTATKQFGQWVSGTYGTGNPLPTYGFFQTDTGNASQADNLAGHAVSIDLDSKPNDATTPQLIFGVADGKDATIAAGSYALDFGKATTAQIDVPVASQKATDAPFKGTLVWTLATKDTIN
ncbi:WxL domain-containing protein [Schleiferilactobacillus shenzhenensis]|nr:WxL domain-containing protein [Schleiferilactobacillus shenzhenensis]